MQVALRERHLDTLFSKCFENSEVQIALQPGGGLYLPNCPGPKLKVERTLSKFSEDNFGTGVGENIRMAPGNGEENFSHNFRIAIVRNTNGKRYPDLPVIGSPIRNALIDELGVGNDNNDVIVGSVPMCSARVVELCLHI